jgi:hypothetical protein
MGDVIDARDETMGAWFEAKIIKIVRATNNESEPEKQHDDKKQEQFAADDAQEVKGENNSGGINNVDKIGATEDGYLYRIIFEK